MRWLRGWVKPEKVEIELLELIHYSKVSGTKDVENNTQEDDKIFKKLDYLKNPLIYRPFSLLMVYFFISFIVSFSPGRPFLGKILHDAGVLKNQNLLLV